jgi:aryl-alcohol dehydrogenase-like predicted oxidoreductase
MSTNRYSRRDFLGTITGGLALGAAFVKCQKPGPLGIPVRPLGKTGEDVSIICLGGWDVAAAESEKESISIMHEALDNGITFWDNCWEYHKGYAEEVMGKAMKEGKIRSKVFLMTKVCARPYELAKKYLEDSLTRLQTDYLDLWQFHAIQWEGDPETIINRETGALRAALEAQKEGKVRYIGFTGHKHPKYHRGMLDAGYEFDTVQMPTNILDPHYHSFQKEILPVLNERNIGVIGMKSLAAQNGRIPRETGLSPSICRRYALSLPISSLCCGIQNKEQLHHDINLARDFKPLTEEEIKSTISQVEATGKDGQVEIYKATNWGRCGWLRENVEI